MKVPGKADPGEPEFSCGTKCLKQIRLVNEPQKLGSLEWGSRVRM
jgi:hypothetical protein